MVALMCRCRQAELEEQSSQWAATPGLHFRVAVPMSGSCPLFKATQERGTPQRVTEHLSSSSGVNLASDEEYIYMNKVLVGTPALEKSGCDGGKGAVWANAPLPALWTVGLLRLPFWAPHHTPP